MTVKLFVLVKGKIIMWAKTKGLEVPEEWITKFSGANQHQILEAHLQVQETIKLWV